MNFYDAILEAVRKSIFDDLVIKDPDDPQYSAKQDDANPVQVRTNPNLLQYNTPLWQVLVRPPTPQELRDTNLIPSVFLRVAQGQRSASGRIGVDGRVRGTTTDIAEDYQIGIQGVFRNGFGADDGTGNAQSLSRQINGFVHDLNICITPDRIRGQVNMLLPTEEQGRLNIQDAYIIDWVSQDAFEGTQDQIVTAVLSVTMNWRRPYVR